MDTRPMLPVDITHLSRQYLTHDDRAANNAPHCLPFVCTSLLIEVTLLIGLEGKYLGELILVR